MSLLIITLLLQTEFVTKSNLTNKPNQSFNRHTTTTIQSTQPQPSLLSLSLRPFQIHHFDQSISNLPMKTIEAIETKIKTISNERLQFPSSFNKNRELISRIEFVKLFPLLLLLDGEESSVDERRGTAAYMSDMLFLYFVL